MIALSPNIQQKLKSYALPVGIALACILAAWLAALATNNLMKEAIVTLGSATQSTNQAEDAPLRFEDFNVLMSKNLLDVLLMAPNTTATGQMIGQTQEARGPVVDTEAVPLSAEPWTLRGTIADDINTRLNRAFILVDGKEGLYRLGDAIKDWTVVAVQRGSVIIEKGGKQERLSMGGGSDFLAKRPDFQRKLNRNRLQAVLRDIPTLMRALVVRPSQVGNTKGLSVVSIDTQSYLNELGLQVGDTLVSLDNQPLQGFGDLANFMTLVNNEVISLEIMRNGQRTIIHYQMQ